MKTTDVTHAMHVEAARRFDEFFDAHADLTRPRDREAAILRWVDGMITVGDIPAEIMEAMPEVSRSNETQIGPQEYECGCVAIVHVTDRDVFAREQPFEMRLAKPCDGSCRCTLPPAPRLRVAITETTAALLKTLEVEDPAAVNHGHCEVWATRVARRAGGKVVWLGDLIDADQYPIDQQPRIGHCVLFLEGRFFDSEHPAGVEDVLLLAGFDADQSASWECGHKDAPAS